MEEKQRNYLFQATIIECRNLKTENYQQFNDIFVKINVADQCPQITSVTKGTTGGEWNQTFTFSNLSLSEEMYRNAQIIFEVYFLKNFSKNTMIGSFSMNVATLYENINHEIHNSWLTLTCESFQHQITGYLKVSCFIISQNDKPPVHLEGETQEQNVYNEVPLEENRNKIQILRNPKVVKKLYQLNVNVV